MKIRLLLVIGLGFLTAVLSGCHCCDHTPPARPGCTVVPPPACPPGAPPALAPGPPPAAVSPPPAGSWTPPPATQRYYEPNEPPMAPPPEVRLSPPVSTSPEPPLAETPKAADERPPSPSLPVGIPQFAYASDRVATGLKPMLDGFDWLETNHFRTVLHVRPAGTDDAADRRLAEKHGLKFVTLDASPQTLNRDTVEAFNRLVGDASAQPLFVYDHDGTLVGGLWYLHFRTVEKLGDEEARTRAGRLGLKTNGDAEQRTMWVAIQKYLSER